jgi:malate synthase
MNVAPAGFNLERDVALGFTDFFLPLHKRFTPEQRRLVEARAKRLERALAGDAPSYSAPSAVTQSTWRIEPPPWVRSPRITFDFEDTMVNTWEHLVRRQGEALAALHGDGGASSDPVVWTRVRGLHLAQAGIISHTPASASLFDLAYLVYRSEYRRLRHPLCIYIPKSESADEALWWSAVFDALTAAKGWPRGSIKAVAVVESQPLAHELEEFLFNSREYVIGFDFGPWNYIASSIHYNFSDPAWVLSDRDARTTEAPFVRAARTRTKQIAEGHGCICAASVAPISASCEQQVGLREPVAGSTLTTLRGTRNAVLTAIRYRYQTLEGRATLSLDGATHDLSIDRLCRLMIAQRLRHRGTYTPRSLSATFDEELERILDESPAGASQGAAKRYRRAREISEAMILSGRFDPV